MRRSALALVLCAGSVAHAGDVVVLADGHALALPTVSDPPSAADFAASPLTVFEENLDAVVYRQAGIPEKQSLARTQVRAVHHDAATTPPELAAGRALATAGKSSEARERLAHVARDVAAPAWARAEAAFLRAKCLAAGDDLDAAARELAAFQQDQPRSRYVLDAKRLRARALADLGRDSEAKSEYAAAARLPGTDDDEKSSLGFLAAWVDVAAALRASDARAAENAMRPIAEIRTNAVLRPALLARCDAARAAVLDVAGKDEDAGAAARQLVTLSDDPFVLAVANSVLGDVARRRGKTRADVEEAQERYLRAVLLYRDAEGAADLVAASWFHAAELFLELAREDGPAAAAEAQSRARREWEDLARRFPRSEWARRARAAVAKLP